MTTHNTDRLRFQDQRVLITGASGYLGSQLTRALVDSGAEVHCIVRTKSNLHLLKPLEDRISLHTYDGTYPSLFQVTSEVQPFICFHLASRFIAQHEPHQIDDLIESNITFGLHLVEALANSVGENSVKAITFINTGTAWQNANGSPYFPVSLYAATKQAYEDLLEYYWRHRNFNICTLKLFDTYGPGDPRKKLVKLLIQRAQDPAPLAMTEGEQLIDLVYIDDVIEAFLTAAEYTVKNPGSFRYTVSSRSPVSVKNLVRLIENQSNIKLPIAWGKLPYRPIEMFEPWNAGDHLPGWQPKVNLETGILKTIEASKG